MNTWFDVHKIIQNSVNDFTKFISCTYHVSLMSKPFHMQGDPDRLKDFFNSLFKSFHSIKLKEKQVKIITSNIGAHNLIEIISNSKESSAAIFHEVFNHSAIDLFDGKVQFESTGQASFKVEFYLPAKINRNLHNQQSDQIIDPKDFGRVLFCEDNIDLGELILDVLQDLNLNVDYISNSQEALEVPHTCEYDLLITDLYMPKVSGIELYKSMSENQKRNKNLEVIFCSGEDDYNLAKLIKDKIPEPFDYHVLPKPFDREELLRILYKILMKKEGKVAI